MPWWTIPLIRSNQDKSGLAEPSRIRTLLILGVELCFLGCQGLFFNCVNCGRVKPCSGPLWGSQSERVQWMASSSFQERRLPYGISLCGFSNHSQFWNQNHTGHIESLCPASSSSGWIPNQLQKTQRWVSSKETPSFALHFISVLKDSPCTLKEGFPSPSVILNPKLLNILRIWILRRNFF